MEKYTASIFDRLENMAHVVEFEAGTDDLGEIILLAYSKLFDLDSPLTQEDVDRDRQLFADLVVVSLFKNPGPNLLPKVE